MILNTQKKSKHANYSMPLHIYRDCSILFFISSNPCSRSLKLLAFRYLQRHIKHKGSSLHMFKTLRFLNCPFQLPNKSLTLQGITQATPNNWISALHNFVATSQWMRKWSINSPHFLHIQHNSITIIFIFRKSFKVKVFPKATVHTKNTTLEGTLLSKYSSKEKWILHD